MLEKLNEILIKNNLITINNNSYNIINCIAASENNIIKLSLELCDMEGSTLDTFIEIKYR